MRLNGFDVNGEFHKYDYNELDNLPFLVEKTYVDGLAADTNAAIATLAQTVDGFDVRVANAEGDISAISQTVNGITLSTSTVTERGEVYARLTLKIGEQNLYGYIKQEV